MFVGLTTLVVKDLAHDLEFPCQVFYSTNAESKNVAFGPYVISVSMDASVDKKNTPLIILSHGSGGTHLAYRDLIFSLISDGLTVVCPLHYGNNRNDNHLSDDRKNLIYRPEHLVLALNSVLQIDEFKTDRIGFIGHSMGGYAGLVLAGGQPWRNREDKLPLNPDARIKCFVFLSPAAGYFAAPNALDQVKQPLQIWVGEKDEFTPPSQAEFVRDHVPQKTYVDFHMVKNGNHFSFLSPYPKELSHLQPAKDLPGFNRVDYQKFFFPKVKEFLSQFI